MRFLLTNDAQIASKLFLIKAVIHCELTREAIRYKGMRQYSPVSTLRPEAGGPYGRPKG
jgi:hypothetical protein